MMLEEQQRELEEEEKEKEAFTNCNAAALSAEHSCRIALCSR